MQWSDPIELVRQSSRIAPLAEHFWEWVFDDRDWRIAFENLPKPFVSAIDQRRPFLHERWVKMRFGENRCDRDGRLKPFVVDELSQARIASEVAFGLGMKRLRSTSPIT